ncbi:MAG: murein transglycosylase domain-containing protein, partial [Betaproteobacteria bacterium]|nr:murein transglycosylase domain-containing protein [Betaproteobacteria bacterium]
QRREFRKYVAGIEGKWGTEGVRTSTQKDYVGYDKDFTQRRIVDFEKGKATVEVLVDQKEAADPEKVKKKIEEQIVALLRDRGVDDPMAAKEHAKPLAKPILAGQVPSRDGAPVTPDSARQFAEGVAMGSTIRTREVVGKDGVTRINASAGFSLMPDHLKRRAGEFRELIVKQARRFNLDPRLVFALVHSESYFNPKARSPAPAYGMMQLVPASGGRTAYLHVYKQDKLVTADYLYSPSNNVELGAGLLNAMLTRDFRNIKDEKSRVYCAIAGYNTGPGNVAKSFVGKRDIPRAVAKINQMTSDQVFEHLRRNLPFEETRTYMKTVTGHMPTYAEWSAR